MSLEDLNNALKANYASVIPDVDADIDTLTGMDARLTTVEDQTDLPDDSLLDGASPVFNATTSALSYGESDDFPGSDINSKWTQLVDANGHALVTGGYLELKDEGTVTGRTQIHLATLAPHVPFDCFAHIERISSDYPSNCTLMVSDAGDTEFVSVGHFVDVANVKLTEHATDGGSGYINNSMPDAGWFRITYDGKTSRAYVSTSGEGTVPTQWTLSSERTDSSLQVPKRLTIFSTQWNDTAGKESTYRVRHFRFRYL